jgi:hypothetical protein
MVLQPILTNNHALLHVDFENVRVELGRKGVATDIERTFSVYKAIFLIYLSVVGLIVLSTTVFTSLTTLPRSFLVLLRSYCSRSLYQILPTRN